MVNPNDTPSGYGSINYEPIIIALFIMMVIIAIIELIIIVVKNEKYNRLEEKLKQLENKDKETSD